MYQVTDFQKIGVGLAGFGIAFLFLGVLFLFDKGLLAIGNILFICGLAFVIGLERTFRFFFQRHKLKATSFFVGGILIVLLGWPVIGMCVEMYGLSFVQWIFPRSCKLFTKSSNYRHHSRFTIIHTQ
ncbi:vesicle transport protein GOT1B-like [Saccostrea cucullata]|uniref:vesicle transport protein GOT1B-like n=1 Tax=Saccostrea cuccullata TaxID=36930 RepID=UPI002ED2BDB4